MDAYSKAPGSGSGSRPKSRIYSVLRSSVAVAACGATLLPLLAPLSAAAMAEFICPGTRYVYNSGVGFPDPANTSSTCVTAYDGGTLAADGTFNAVTPFGAGWSATVNIFGQLLRITNAIGITWNLGTLPVPVSSIGDSPALQTTYSYDSLNRIQSTTAPGSQTTTYAYDSLNRMVTTVAPSGNQTTYSYDTSGRPDTVTETNPAGHTITYAYDSLNRPVQATDSGGRVLTYTYDAQNNLTTRTDTAGLTTTYTYDATFNRLETVETPNHRTTYAYDAMGNVMSSTEQSLPTPSTPFITQYQYDAQGDVTQVIDPANIVTRYTYDALNRLTSSTEDFGGSNPLTTTFVYDARGSLADIIDPAGAHTTFSSVPAPGTFVLLSLGLAALALRRRLAGRKVSAR